MRNWGLLAVLLLAGCGDEVTPRPAQATFSIRVDDPFIDGVTPVVNLAVELHGSERDGSLIEAAGSAVHKIGTDLITGHPPIKGEFEALNIVFLTDKPGPDAAVGRKLLHVSFKDQELRQLTHFGADGDGLLAGATEAGWWTPVNDEVINDYCSGHKASGFCQKFLR